MTRRGATKLVCERCGKTFFELAGWDSYGMCRDCCEWEKEGRT